MKLTLVFCFCLLASKLLAQDDKGVIVHKDPRADLLVKKQIEVNELNTRDARRYVQGYRILIISSNDRNQANDAKTKVYKNFPELKAYLSYQAPYYKLKVGNFTNTKDAEVYLKKIQLYFPATVYIIRDMIVVNPDKSAELN